MATAAREEDEYPPKRPKQAETERNVDHSRNVPVYLFVAIVVESDVTQGVIKHSLRRPASPLLLKQAFACKTIGIVRTRRIKRRL